MEKTRVLFADKDISLCKSIGERATLLENIRIDTLYYDEDIVSLLSEIYYDIVIVDVNMINEDDVTAIYKSNPDPIRHPMNCEIILTSDNIECDRIFKTDTYDPIYLIKKPFDVEFLLKLISLVSENRDMKEQIKKGASAHNELDECINQALISIGIPPSMNGYKYLYTGLTAAFDDMELLAYITKDLYTEIAKVCGVSVSKVEKSIRNAISAAWERGDAQILSVYFGSTVGPNSKKPSNSEFFRAVINRIKLDSPHLSTQCR